MLSSASLSIMSVGSERALVVDALRYRIEWLYKGSLVRAFKLYIPTTLFVPMASRHVLETVAAGTRITEALYLSEIHCRQRPPDVDKCQRC